MFQAIRFTNDPAYRRLLWATKRGMLELDLMLAYYVQHHFLQLTAEKQQQFIHLLQQEDTQLFHWLLQSEPPESPFETIIQDIVQCNQKKASQKRV